MLMGVCVQGVILSPELWLVKLMVGAVDPTYVSVGPWLGLMHNLHSACSDTTRQCNCGF